MPLSLRRWIRQARAAVVGGAFFVVGGFVAGGLGVALSPVPAQADPVSDSRVVIEQQLEAFSRDAWNEAFAFASPGIQNIFQTPDRFGQMVREGYPMVWRPADVAFLDSAEDGVYLVQRLRLIDAQGQAFIARYAMVEIDGVWRIAGVQIERDPGAV